MTQTPSLTPGRWWHLASTETQRMRHTAYMRIWRAENRDKVNAQKRASYAADPEPTRAAVRAYRSENVGRVRASLEKSVHRRRAYASDYRRRNKDVVSAQIHRRRARLINAAGAEYTTVQHIRDRFAMWGNKCRYCGADATSIDHRIPLSRGGSHWPSNLVPACGDCNCRKRTKTESEFMQVLLG